MIERRSCVANASNNYHCKKLWTMESYDENTYVAGIEDYTVMVVSSYYRRGMHGTSTNHQGFYYECRDPKTDKIIGTSKCKNEELLIKKIECLPFLNCDYKSVRHPPRG